MRVKEALNYFHYNLIQILLRFLLLPIIKTCVIWEGVQSGESLGMHPNNCVQMFIEAILQFWLHENNVENVCSSCIDPNTCTIIISANLKISKNECLMMQEASNVLQNHVKGLTWNGTSIVATTLDFMVILNMLVCISRLFMNKMDGQIMATSKDVLDNEILIGSKCHLM